MHDRCQTTRIGQHTEQPQRLPVVDAGVERHQGRTAHAGVGVVQQVVGAQQRVGATDAGRQHQVLGRRQNLFQQSRGEPASVERCAGGLESRLIALLALFGQGLVILEASSSLLACDDSANQAARLFTPGPLRDRREVAWRCYA